MEGRALGKGLTALIPSNNNASSGDVRYVQTESVVENKNQPRIKFDSEDLSDLISSIKEKGILQPILVREKNNGYEVIAGERRLRAAKSLSLNEVPVIIKAVSDEEALVLGLIENIQRSELNPLEEARAFSRLIEEYSLSQEALAKSVGKDRSTVSNSLRLLKLPQEIQESLFKEEISMGHARALSGVELPQKQEFFFRKVKEKGISVRELENLIREAASPIPSSGKVKLAKKEPHMADLEGKLQGFLGTKVRIEQKKKRGKIVIEFYSNADLDRILAIIQK